MVKFRYARSKKLNENGKETCKKRHENIISNGKAKKGLIKNVIETPSNLFLARQNVLVKGSIIETELGKTVITNRPSQEGNIQAKIIQ
ncbi:hypothetical protein J4416_02730 [Candidatus Pacearchaeota archaeon]|nr:hypothetical protein [Candidatus Pacearchaeota archaeon]